MILCFGQSSAVEVSHRRIGSLRGPVASDFIDPIDHLGIAATSIDHAGQAIAGSAAGLIASHARHIALTDQTAEYS